VSQRFGFIHLSARTSAGKTRPGRPPVGSFDDRADLALEVVGNDIVRLQMIASRRPLGVIRGDFGMSAACPVEPAPESRHSVGLSCRWRCQGGRGQVWRPQLPLRLTPSMRARLAAIHQREPDGSLTPLPDLQLPPDPEVHMGGHGLYASIGEYMKFIRMWLNDGAGPGGAVLKKETVEAAVRNGLLPQRGSMRQCCVATSNRCRTPPMPKTPSPRYCCWNKTQPVGFQQRIKPGAKKVPTQQSP